MVADYALIGEITWGQTEFLVQASTTSYCFSHANSRLQCCGGVSCHVPFDPIWNLCFECEVLCLRFYRCQGVGKEDGCFLRCGSCRIQNPVLCILHRLGWSKHVKALYFTGYLDIQKIFTRSTGAGVCPNSVIHV